jgi:hypothetical protein
MHAAAIVVPLVGCHLHPERERERCVRERGSLAARPRVPHRERERCV